MVKIVMKIGISIVLMFLVVNQVSAKEYRLNPNYNIPKLSPESRNILKHYEKFMNFVKRKPMGDQLRLVNNYLNDLNAQFDDKRGVKDYWSSRGEFLSRGGGDCEDYAIAKYYTLKDLGFKPSNMCLLVVQERYSKSYHMVLGVWTDTIKVPKILDNLSFRVLPFPKRTDLKAKYCINETGYYVINKQGHKLKSTLRVKAYEDMLKKQKNENIWQKNSNVLFKKR